MDYFSERFKELDVRYKKEQSEFYDYLAKQGGWVDFAHLKANEQELHPFSLILFNILCEERGFEHAFDSPTKSY